MHKQSQSLSRFNRLIASVLLFGAVGIAHANDVQDASKLFKQGQQTQALEKVNAYLATKPKDAQGRFLKGLILTDQGKVNDAISIFTGLTEDYPELPEPYNNLAVLYASQSQYDKARQALEMAIRTHPSYATAHENLGDIYAKLASQAYDRALQLDRSNANTQTKLALIQDLFSGNGHSKPVAAAAPVAAPVAAVTPVAKPAVVAAAPVPAPVAVKPVSPAAKPAAVETPVKVNSGDEVLKTINAWASAWSSKNSKKYLSFYARDFKTPKGQSRSAWETSRKERISAPKSIEVDISNASVSFSDDSHATVKFRQSYRASHTKISANKTMLMVKSGGNWLIQEERAR